MDGKMEFVKFSIVSMQRLFTLVFMKYLHSWDTKSLLYPRNFSQCTSIRDCTALASGLYRICQRDLQYWTILQICIEVKI